jgi:hypothetical protein
VLARQERQAAKGTLTYWDAVRRRVPLDAAAPSLRYCRLLGRDWTLTGGPLVRVVGSVDIDRPASQVWAYVADYGHDAS